MAHICCMSDGIRHVRPWTLRRQTLLLLRTLLLVVSYTIIYMYLLKYIVKVYSLYRQSENAYLCPIVRALNGEKSFLAATFYVFTWVTLVFAFICIYFGINQILFKIAFFLNFTHYRWHLAYTNGTRVSVFFTVCLCNICFRSHNSWVFWVFIHK